MNSLKYFIFTLILGLIITSCSSTDDTISPEEQAKLDQESILNFLNSSTIDTSYFVGEMANNIEWKIRTMTSEDSLNKVSTLYDIMGQSYVDTIVDGIEYKVYYHIFKDAGSGTVVDSLNSSIQVDYEAYYLGASIPTDATTVYSINFNLVDLYQCWQIVLPKIKSGLKNSSFDTSCDCDPYRQDIDNPGKVIIVSPSAMNGYTLSNMMFNVVLYDHDVPN